MKIKNKANKRTNINKGFTLIETLIAITFISLIGLPLLMVFSDTVSFSRKIKDLNRWNKELIKLERTLRKSVSEVHIPYWISDIEITEKKGNLMVPFWNGDPDLYLKIAVEDMVLKITTPMESGIFKDYDGVDLDFLKDCSERTVGLSIVVKKSKKENITFQCSFGSIGREVFTTNL